VNGLWSSVERPRHARHRRVALAADPRADTVQAVSARPPGIKMTNGQLPSYVA